MSLEKKKELVSFFMNKNFMITPDILKNIPDDFDYDNFFENVAGSIEQQQKPTALDLDKFNALVSFKPKIDDINTSIEIVKTYNNESVKREIQHFVVHFKNRYNALMKILQSRIELQNVISIKRALDRNTMDRVAVIGLVSEKRVTANNNIILKIEDPTGEINVLIKHDKAKLVEESKDIVMDEMIGITGVTGEKIIFANDLYLPDVPLSKELKKAPGEAYAAFISDLHVGSDMFLEKDFLRFISWLNCETGTEEQKEIARKVKYLFIIGDMVDGVGIYPNQESELLINDIYEQYNECARYLSMIRKDIHLIMCPGNHDALRIAEPQPHLDKNYAKAMYELPNATIVSNPAYVNIHKTEGFPGFNVLLYHGYCFDFYIANVDSIRNNGGYDRADLVMNLLLRKRHLSPSHSSTLYIPDTEKDPLVIEDLPDFFISGHIHKTSVSNYRNITTICGSCWQAKTSFQEKVGHHPEPCRVPVVNLKTRQIKILRFDNEGS